MAEMKKSKSTPKVLIPLSCPLAEAAPATPHPNIAGGMSSRLYAMRRLSQ